jgi:multicomponent Na+:H+ antiporter subunit D
VVQASRAPMIYRFGGWEVREGIVIGISFALEPLGTGLAFVAAVLVCGAFLFSWRYFDAVGALFHVLMLVFLAGMVGLCLTSDLFNLFVFFELMSVAAYALTGYETEETGPLQGALNFAVSNSIGATMVLMSIALLYGRTGALNLAEIGLGLEGAQPDGLVVVAFVLLLVGFLTKAAIVPFHLWLPDAYASAPTPVCVIFAGVTSELGLFALARVYWTVFAPSFGSSAADLRTALVVMGALTAVVGAVLCIAQDRLKRMLAFATVGHAGLFLIGIALLDAPGVAGAATYMLADGLLKASLFMGVGIVQHRLRDVDENRLRGRGRELPLLAVLLACGGLALAGLPPFGPFLGKSLIEEAAEPLGYRWITPVVVAVSVLTSAAVLRATARVFLGWGTPERSDRYARGGDDDEVEPETIGGRDRTPATMLVPAILLLVAALGVGLWPALHRGVEAASERFADAEAYRALVLEGDDAPLASSPQPPIKPVALVYGFASTLGALLVAATALYRRRLPAGMGRVAHTLVHRPLEALRGMQSGKVGDYVAWLAVGATTLGAVLAVILSA